MLAAGGAAILGIWTTAIIVSAVIRWFLLEFAGDVAIYVSSHKLNRFYETRQAIKAACFTSAEAVYRFGGYGQHIVMGHSLGSLVAYDTLNRLINEDLLNGGLNVRPRTRLLLTFGSPLDKVAFLFRAQSEFSDVREALASTTQPLISNPAMRPPWINISSPEDIISGKLDYYDPEYGHTGPSAQARAGVEPSELTPPPPIFNVVDPDAWIPLIAHTQYWTNAKLIEVLMDAIQTPETHA